MKEQTLEIEAKFLIPTIAMFKQLQNLTQLGSFFLQSIGTKQVVDTYLDTSGKQILQSNFACRIRKRGEETILTLKSLTPAEGIVHRRQELEAVGHNDQPLTWPNSPAQSLLLDMIGIEPLETLFTIQQTRYKYHVILNDQPIIELSLDKVWLNHTTDPTYYELEAELLSAGTDDDLIHFTTLLRDNWALMPESQSKFERALHQTTI